MYAHQGFPEIEITELIKWIEIGTDGARKQDGVLWNNSQTGAQVMQFNFRNIDAVDRNAAFSSLKKAEEGE